MTTRTDERGFALPVAMLALVVVGVLVTGGFYMAQQEGRIGVAGQQTSRAFYLAEAGLSNTVANWHALGLTSLAVGDSTQVVEASDWGVTHVMATRLTSYEWLFDATTEITRGGSVQGGATRRLGLVAKQRRAQLEPPAALTTRGDTNLRGDAQVLGQETDPSEWGAICDAYGSEDKPGVLTDETSEVTTQGSAHIDGDPPVQHDPTIADSTFTQFGELDWAELTGMADKTLAGGTYSSTAPTLNADLTCNIGDPFNWGDPLNPGAPCADYFPIVHLTGTTTLQSGGFGQGILLVDGDLDLRGSFIYYGVIIVQGAFETQGSGHRIMGGVLASNADIDVQALVGGSIVQNSTCAAERAIEMNQKLNRLIPLQTRSWIDLSSVSD